jgi:hypothetical protein
METWRSLPCLQKHTSCPVLSQISSVHILTLRVRKVSFNIILWSKPRFFLHVFRLNLVRTFWPLLCVLYAIPISSSLNYGLSEIAWALEMDEHYLGFQLFKSDNVRLKRKEDWKNFDSKYRKVCRSVCVLVPKAYKQFRVVQSCYLIFSENAVNLLKMRRFWS